VDACITESPLWSKFTRMCLTKNMRLSEGIDIANFSQMLINIGDGQYPITKPPSTITIPPCLQSSAIASTNMKDFIDEIYPDLEANYRNKDYLLDRGILVPLNRNVDDMNNAIIDVLHLSANDITTYQSIDTVEETDSHLYPVEFLNSINIPGIPPHTIQLGVGMIIMLLRNLDLHNGHCNGSRYIITKLCPHIIEAQTIGRPVNQKLFILRITLIL
jgi:ATP-dependent DNA helicase PIF1